jgi:hypothetical protein
MSVVARERPKWEIMAPTAKGWGTISISQALAFVS